MGHKKDDAFDHAQRSPTLLAFDDAIHCARRKRIVEHEAGRVESDSMLDAVAGVLG